MLRVTIESLPAEGKRKTLAVLNICNVSGNEEIANYSWVLKRENHPTPIGLVQRHRRADGYIALLKKVVAQIWSN